MGLEYDYRKSLLKQLYLTLKARGYTHLRAISGVESPYPNGPEPLFKACGFDRVKYMGKLLLRHKWEDAWLMRLGLNI